MKRFSAAARTGVLAIILVTTLGCRGNATPANTAPTIPSPAVDISAGSATSAKAIVAGGCFWGIQGVFQHVKGVTSAVSGYAGGDRGSAVYEVVSSGTTGHAESVEITYDPRQVSFGQLLQIFFSVHDPTELNFQGPDDGPQYRSAIFPVDAEQARVAQAYITQLDQAHAYAKPIVTKVEPGKFFFPAEDYHQDFLVKNPNNAYIVINDLPKIESLKQLFPGRYRADPVLVGGTAAS
jgi:peptide-methionine (S)-S-oxide reductase